VKWNGIIDLTPSASGLQTNTAGNIRNLVVHKGNTFPTGTSIPQSGQLFFYTGASSSSFPSPMLYSYDGAGWTGAGGGGGGGSSGYSGWSGISGYSGFSGTSAYVRNFVNGDLTGGSMLAVNHGLGQSYVVVEAWDNTGEAFMPDIITVVDANNITVNLASYAPLTGTWHIVAAAGNGTSGYSGFSGYSGAAPSGYVKTFTNTDLSGGSMLTVTHNLGQSYIVSETWDNVGRKVMPDEVTLVDANSLTINFASYSPIAGTWHTVAGNGNGPAGTSGYSGYSGIGTSGYSGGSGISGYSGAGMNYTQSFVNADLSGGSILTVPHNLGQSFIVTEVYDNAGDKIIPDGINVASANSLTVNLAAFAPITGTWHITASGGNGLSGYSGFSGVNGSNGISGYSGSSGYSGQPVGAHAQMFLSSGTFTAPVGFTKVVLSMVGGGGSGGNGAGANGGAGGGAGGQWVYRMPYTVIGGNTYTVTIGAGGISPGTLSTNGNPGNATVFDSFSLAGGDFGRTSGGIGGVGATDTSMTGQNWNAGGAGGFSKKYGGGSGSSGQPGNDASGGGGGGTAFAAGGAGSYGDSTNGAFGGGGGGGGGSYGSAGGGGRGGNGGDGFVYVEW